MTRSPEEYVHGDQVIVPSRVAGFILSTMADRLRTDLRTRDPEIYAVLVAMRYVALQRGKIPRSKPGTKLATKPVKAGEWKDAIGVANAAARLGFTDRAVRKAISEGRLAARKIDGRWWIDPDDLNNYRSNRAA